MRLEKVLFAGLTMFAALALTAPAHAEYGALAYDEASGKYGIAYNERTQQRADETARKDCGGEKCKLMPFGPRDCAALATVEDRKESNAWGGGRGGTRAAAELQAMESCQKHTKRQCKIRVAECNR